MSQPQKAQANDKLSHHHSGAGNMHIVYYTDPLCCWSWAMEPQLARFQNEWQEAITWRYCLAGLLPGWKNYVDAVNDVTRPVQMGPVWLHASQLTGVPMPHRIWMEDPPASSYPACLAVKCAGLQSLEAEERFLRFTREALMVAGRNIARREVLNSVAERLFAEDPQGFSIDRFMKDLQSDRPLEAFRADMQEAQNRHIKRFPTFILTRAGHPAIQVTGYKSWESLLRILHAA